MNRVLIFGFLIFQPMSFVMAAFDSRDWSARVASLGGAFTAVSDDPAGIFYNAAATLKQNVRQGNFSYARLFGGLKEVDITLSQAAYTQPLGRKANVGIGWGGFDSHKLYREDIAVLSFAREFGELLQNFNGKLMAGFSVRYLTRRFVLDERSYRDPVFFGDNRTHAVTFDLHFYTVPDTAVLPGLSFGLSLKSLNQPDIGFADGERLPFEAAGGALYRWMNCSLPIDIVHRNGEIRKSLGLEIFLLEEKFVFRSGSDFNQVGGGIGFRQKVTGNFQMNVDYGFSWPLKISDTIGSHRATVGVRF